MNPLLNIGNSEIMNFQHIFNLIQRYKGKVKFFDLRNVEAFESCHLESSLNICPERYNTENLSLEKITHEKELSRLRRYCLIIGFSSENEDIAIQLKEMLNKLKCRDIFMLSNVDEFFSRYFFLGNSNIKEFPNEIIPEFLFLGSQEHAHNRDIVEILRITHVLNVTRGAANPFSGLKYCRVHVDDAETEQISLYFQKAYDFIDTALVECMQGRKCVVLVHCAKGVSRSATIVIMYIMRALGFSLSEAFNFIKTHRNIIEPNEGFIKELQEFEINNHEFPNIRFNRRASMT